MVRGSSPCCPWLLAGIDPYFPGHTATWRALAAAAQIPDAVAGVASLGRGGVSRLRSRPAATLVQATSGSVAVLCESVDQRGLCARAHPLSSLAMVARRVRAVSHLWILQGSIQQPATAGPVACLLQYRLFPVVSVKQSKANATQSVCTAALLYDNWDAALDESANTTLTRRW